MYSRSHFGPLYPDKVLNNLRIAFSAVDLESIKEGPAEIKPLFRKLTRKNRDIPLVDRDNT